MDGIRYSGTLALYWRSHSCLAHQVGTSFSGQGMAIQCELGLEIIVHGSEIVSHTGTVVVIALGSCAIHGVLAGTCCTYFSYTTMKKDSQIK